MQDAGRVADGVRYFETFWIPMRDGTRLAARLWLPENADEHPVPALLEYIPYRRRDGTRDWDDLTHPYFGANGYASVRLDMRGSGDSDGVLLDEYLSQEQQDAIDAIAWLATQPWCNGRVGMFGISWGGFNGLQVAAHRPPALKAVISLCSTDDRYADDMHFMGGSFTTGNLEWGATFFTIMARSPDPRIVGSRWREMWQARLEAVSPVYHTWFDHQHRDAYWRHGSVCEDFAAIACPVMAIGGWADGYTNPVFRLLAGLKVPRLGIVGPWGHKYPHFGVPGPAIGFLQEAVRWWDHWLKDRDTGIMQEPMLRAYLQDPVRPAPYVDHRPGRWVGVDWPPRAAQPLAQSLAPGVMGEKLRPKGRVTVSSPQSLGIAGGEWCAYGLGGLGPDLPDDQGVDDARAVCFDGAPLDAPLALLGAPALDLSLRADRPVALLVARLCAIAPDGASERMSYGVLNLTHRNGHAAPEPLTPGETYRIRLQLNDMGYVLPAGYRLRLAISSAYWPIVWPSPEAATIEIDCARSQLRLPRLAEGALAAPAPRFADPVTGPKLQYTVHRASSAACENSFDAASGIHRRVMRRDDGDATIEDIGVRVSFTKVMRYEIRDGDPATARMETEFDARNRHAEWDTRVSTRSLWTCSDKEFQVVSELRAYEGDEEVFSRRWQHAVPRRLM
jgi:hypothetical protein